jgi:hypothetical protein
MAELELKLLAALGLVGGPVMFARGFRDLRVMQMIRDTPTARIGSMAMGLVEISGQTAARSTVEAPFSGRRCVYWQVDIAVRGRKKDGWNVVHRNSSGHPFFVQDGTGSAMIYPQGADCRLNFGVEEECAGLMLPDLYARYMSERGLGMRHLWRIGQMRFRERTLEEGQAVYVLGTAHPRARAYTVGEGEAMQATGTDGLTDWSARRIADLQNDAVGIVRRGEHEKVFIISQQSEKQLTTLHGLKAFAKLTGGPAAALLGLWYWLDVWRRMSH